MANRPQGEGRKSELPTLAEQIADKCVHFTGTMQKTCKAGVAYAAVTVQHEPIEYVRRGVTYTATRSMPCNHRLNHCGATCSASRFPTPEEVTAEVEASRVQMEKMFGCRAAIVQHIKETGVERGVIKCPACKGELGYCRALNGHIWGHCSTEGCASWIE